MNNLNLKIDYTAINFSLIPLIPKNCVNILDVGCGTGDLGKFLKENEYAKNIDGITYSENEAKLCTNKLNQVYVQDLNNIDLKIFVEKQYDCIICSHVLEHLYLPWILINSLSKLLNENGSIIIAVPNLMFYKHRKQLIFGDFGYSLNGGIMDITHYRFFDWKSVDMLFSTTDLKLIHKKGYGNFPQSFIRKIMPKFSIQIDEFFVSKSPNLFSEQFILILSR